MNFISPALLIEFTFAWLILCIIILLFMRKRFVEEGKKKFKPIKNSVKMLIFWLMVLPIIFSTLYISAMTIQENIISVTGGPVHWHADYEVWVCGQKLDLINPEFPRNKIGSPLLHEHNDDRIHVEGTVNDLKDVSLGKYFSVIGGFLTNERISYASSEGPISYSNGEKCPDGTTGEIKVYVNGQRLADYGNYVLYPDAYSPPGDCIIIEFGSTESVSTNKLCASWVAKGWNYDNFEREEKNIGGYTW